MEFDALKPEEACRPAGADAGSRSRAQVARQAGIALSEVLGDGNCAIHSLVYSAAIRGGALASTVKACR